MIRIEDYKHRELFYGELPKVDKETILKQGEIENDYINNATLSCNYIKDKVLTGNDEKYLLENKWNNIDVMKDISCYNNVRTRFKGNELIGRLFRLHNYITFLDTLDEGISGVANFSTISNPPNNPHVNDTHKVTIIKSPKKTDEVTNAEYIHEYFVGAFGVNNLRNEIPNFAYVLGIFECSSPHVLNEKVISFCQNNKRNVVNYIIYEKINGIVLSEFIIDKDEEVILNILTQLILALGVAYEKYEFTHYDLHSNNIIVRELDEEVEIKYTIEGKDYFVVTKYIPTIIDYGRSFIRVDGNPFGYKRYMNGILPDRGFYLTDVTRIVFTTMYKKLGFDQAEDIIELFTNESDIIELLKVGRKNYFMLPGEDKFTSITPSMVIERWSKLNLPFLHNESTNTINWLNLNNEELNLFKSKFDLEDDPFTFFSFIDNLNNDEKENALRRNYVTYADKIIHSIIFYYDNIKGVIKPDIDHYEYPLFVSNMFINIDCLTMLDYLLNLLYRINNEASKISELQSMHNKYNLFLQDNVWKMAAKKQALKQLISDIKYDVEEALDDDALMMELDEDLFDRIEQLTKLDLSKIKL